MIDSKQTPKPDFQLEVNYFQVLKDEPDLQNENLVYAEISTTLSKEQTLNFQNKTDQPDKKNSHLMIFADKSFSMNGINFDTVKNSLKDIANDLFPEKDKLFASIHLIFFNHEINKEKLVNSKSELENFVYLAQAEGGTSFVKCFDKIKSIVQAGDKNSDYQILFLSDGQDPQKDAANNERVNLQKFLVDQKQNDNKSSSFYTIGLGEGHNAEMLILISQTGSEQGNYIYVQGGSGEKSLELYDNIKSCFNFALDAAKEAKDSDSIAFRIKNEESGQNFELNVTCQPQYITEDQDNQQIYNDFNVLNEDQEDQEKEESQAFQDKFWTKVKYSQKVVIPKKILEEGSLAISAQIQQEPLIHCAPQVHENLNPEVHELLEGEIKAISQIAEKRIESLCSSQNEQATSDKKVINKIQEIMEHKLLSLEQMKADISTKNCLRSKLKLGRQEIENVQKILDKAHGKIDNVTKAKLASAANKLHQKVQVQDITEIEKLVKGFDFQQIQTSYQIVFQMVYECVFTKLGLIDIIKQADCMGIVCVVRVRDGVIVVQKILSGFHSVDAFISQNDLMGLENLSGEFKIIFPLYLFEEHWKLVKIKQENIFKLNQKIIGFDFNESTLETLLFQILHQSLLQYSKDSTFEVFIHLILGTSSIILQENSDFTNSLAEKFQYFHQEIDQNILDDPNVKKRLKEQEEFFVIFYNETGFNINDLIKILVDEDNCCSSCFTFYQRQDDVCKNCKIEIQHEDEILSESKLFLIQVYCLLSVVNIQTLIKNSQINRLFYNQEYLKEKFKQIQHKIHANSIYQRLQVYYPHKEILDNQQVQNIQQLDSAFNQIDSINNLIQNFDFQQIQTLQSILIEELQIKSEDQLDLIKTMKQGDCVGMIMNISVFDDKIIIENIDPYFHSVNTFINQKRLEIETQITPDGSKTIIFPVYLFKEHYELVKLKLESIFEINTEISGFDFNQTIFQTLPYQIFYRLVFQHSINLFYELNIKMMQQTCIQIIEENKEFMSSLAQKFLDFKNNYDASNGSEFDEKFRNQEDISFQTNQNVDLVNLIKILIDEDTCCIDCQTFNARDQISCQNCNINIQPQEIQFSEEKLFLTQSYCLLNVDGVEEIINSFNSDRIQYFFKDLQRFFVQIRNQIHVNYVQQEIIKSKHQKQELINSDVYNQNEKFSTLIDYNTQEQIQEDNIFDFKIKDCDSDKIEIQEQQSDQFETSNINELKDKDRCMGVLVTFKIVENKLVIQNVLPDLYSVDDYISERIKEIDLQFTPERPQTIIIPVFTSEEDWKKIEMKLGNIFDINKKISGLNFDLEVLKSLPFQILQQTLLEHSSSQSFEGIIKIMLKTCICILENNAEFSDDLIQIFFDKSYDSEIIHETQFQNSKKLYNNQNFQSLIKNIDELQIDEMIRILIGETYCNKCQIFNSSNNKVCQNCSIEINENIFSFSSENLLLTQIFCLRYASNMTKIIKNKENISKITNIQEFSKHFQTFATNIKTKHFYQSQRSFNFISDNFQTINPGLSPHLNLQQSQTFEKNISPKNQQSQSPNIQTQQDFSFSNEFLNKESPHTNNFYHILHETWTKIKSIKTELSNYLFNKIDLQGIKEFIHELLSRNLFAGENSFAMYYFICFLAIVVVFFIAFVVIASWVLVICSCLVLFFSWFLVFGFIVSLMVFAVFFIGFSAFLGYRVYQKKNQ